jgi:hypothetical protein
MIMNSRLFIRTSRLASLLAGVSMLALTASPVLAATTTHTAAQQARLQTIISKGNQEIARRLATLGTLSSKLNAATKLSAADKASLTSEVATATSGLTSLKTQLDAETTVAGASQDAQSIISGYRVYALVVPKVHLVKQADDEQSTDTKLTALAAKLQTRLTTAQKAGKNVTAVQAQLTDLLAKVSAAQSIASGIETDVVGLKPTDFNSNHSVLSGDAAQLKTAHADNQAAYQDAKSIVAGIKAL